MSKVERFVDHMYLKKTDEELRSMGSPLPIFYMWGGSQRCDVDYFTKVLSGVRMDFPNMEERNIYVETHLCRERTQIHENRSALRVDAQMEDYIALRKKYEFEEL